MKYEYEKEFLDKSFSHLSMRVVGNYRSDILTKFEQ